jgi:spore coat polysaccharide biosynthesis predicted glycosyltransferase SpsG
LPATRGHVLVVDAYRLPKEVFVRAAELNRLVVMHDYGAPPADVALVVTVAGEASSNGPRRLTGPAYAALRPDFWGVPERQLREGVERVLITTGGGQLDAVGCELAQALAEALANVSVSLVRGPDATAAAPDGIETLDAPRSLVEPLLRSDLVVCGAGQTMLEAAAAGTPCIALPLAENQRRQGVRLAELGAVRLIDPPDVSGVTAAALELMHDVAERRSLSREGQRSVDGYGALRVAFEIARLARRAS